MNMRVAQYLAVLIFTLYTGTAAASVFTFSFDNVVGNVSGTVSGRIFGLQDNLGNQAATSILIDSFPAGLGGSFDLSNDPTAWNAQYANTFSVTAGEIVFARFGAQQNPNPNFGTSDGFFLNVGLLTSVGVVTNALYLDNAVTFVGNQLGLAGVRFQAVPEPGTLALLGLGLAGLGLSRRRKVT